MRSLQRRNARFGQKILARALYCICGQCLLPSEKQKRMTKEKFDLLSIPCFIIKMEHLAVQNMESFKNSMTIFRQWTLCEMRKRKGSSRFWKYFRNWTLITIHRWQMEGRRKSACTWIKSRWKTSLTWQSEENAQDTRTTGSCLSTPRDLYHRWTKGTTIRKP